MIGIMFNWDETDFYMHREYLQSATTREKMLQRITHAVTLYQNKHITDFMINIIRHHNADDWQTYNYDYEIDAVRDRSRSA